MFSLASKSANIVEFLLTFVSSETSGGASITIPATAQEGDIAIIFDYAVNASTSGISVPSSVTPSGFTNFANVSSSYEVNPSFNIYNNIRAMVSHKLLVSGDAGTSVTGMNGSGDSKVMIVFRPVTIPSTVTIFDNNRSAPAYNTNPSAYTVEATETPNLVIAWAGGFSLSSSPSPSGSQDSGNLDVDYYLFNEGSASNVTSDIGTVGLSLAAYGAFGLRLS